MQNNLVVVFGSGATCGSGYIHKVTQQAPPTDKDFFTNHKILKLIESEYPAINYFLKNYRFKGIPADLNSLEKIFSVADIGYKVRIGELDLGDCRTWIKISKFLIDSGFSNLNYFDAVLDDLNLDFLCQVFKKKRHSANNYPEERNHALTGELGRELRLLIHEVYKTENYELPTGVIDNYEQLFKLLKDNLLGVVNMNYDLFSENAKRKLNLQTPIYYFHGSLGWREWKEQNALNFERTTPLREVPPNYPQGVIGWQQPSIVPPVIIKNIPNESIPPNLVLNSGNINQVFSELYKEHKEIRKLLLQASSILFVGYSLRQEDEEAIRLFRETIGERANEVSIEICVKEASVSK